MKVLFYIPGAHFYCPSTPGEDWGRYTALLSLGSNLRRVPCPVSSRVPCPGPRPGSAPCRRATPRALPPRHCPPLGSHLPLAPNPPLRGRNHFSQLSGGTLTARGGSVTRLFRFRAPLKRAERHFRSRKKGDSFLSLAVALLRQSSGAFRAPHLPLYRVLSSSRRVGMGRLRRHFVCVRGERGAVLGGLWWLKGREEAAAADTETRGRAERSYREESVRAG